MRHPAVWELNNGEGHLAYIRVYEAFCSMGILENRAWYERNQAMFMASFPPITYLVGGRCVEHDLEFVCVQTQMECYLADRT